MIHKCRLSEISVKITSLFACLLFTFFAGCTGVTIKDDLPPSTPKGHADFANYTQGYDVIYSVKDGRKVREGSLGFKGAALRVARAPGNYDFIIQHEDDSGQRHLKPVSVKIERDMLTFVTVDNRITEVTHGTNEKEPSTTVRYNLNISTSKTPAPMHFESETARINTLHELLNDPDWRARLYGVSSLEKMKGMDKELIKTVRTVASDDPHVAVRRKAAALLKELGIDPFENLLFLENFEGNNKRRWISADGEYTYFYNDEFLFSSTTPTGKCKDEMMTFPLELPRDFDVELMGTWKAGADNDAYGILMGSDKDNFDHFGISGDGRAIVRATRYGELSPDLIGWTKVDGINAHGPNRLRVEVRGNTWKYYVNGAYVGTVENTLQPDTYTFGLRICQGQTIAFDQLKISRVPEN